MNITLFIRFVCVVCVSHNDCVACAQLPTDHHHQRHHSAAVPARDATVECGFSTGAVLIRPLGVVVVVVVVVLTRLSVDHGHWTAIASDNCAGLLPASAITYTDSVAEGTCPGSTIIRRTWQARGTRLRAFLVAASNLCNYPLVPYHADSCGNVGSAVQTITVLDTTPPTITVPPTRTVTCLADAAGNATGVANATDSCGNVTVTYEDMPLVNSATAECSLVGNFTRVWTAVGALFCVLWCQSFVV